MATKTGAPKLFLAIVTFAESCGRIPVGLWRVDLEDGFTLRVNGSKDEWEGLPAWSAAIMTPEDLPLAIVDPRGGSMFTGRLTEADLINMVQRCQQRRAK